MIKFFRTKHLIESMLTQRIVPGVNYALIHNDQVFCSTTGWESLLPTTKQLSPYFSYDLASLTKVFGTTNVFLKLYQEGQLNFTEPVQQFIPEFKDQRVRIFHLLTHTSGIRGWIPHRNELTRKQLLEAIINLPVTDEFETKMRYADTNFILLGLILKKIFHSPVQNVINTQIIEKMPYNELTFHPNAQDSIPTAYVDGHILQGVVHDPKARILKADCGSAGLFGTLDDIIKLAQSYIGTKTGFLPLRQETLAQLFDVKTMGNVHPRSWGWDLCFDPIDHHPIIYHTGFTGTFVLLDRFSRSGLIVLTNRIHPSGHNQIFLTMRQEIVNTFLQENH